MKHVFVETNFLVNLLRPFPEKDAGELWLRSDGTGLQLYLPWCCITEATRTLPRIINDDFSFNRNLKRMAVEHWRPAANPSNRGKMGDFAGLVGAFENKRLHASNSLADRLEVAKRRIEIVHPTQEALNVLVEMFSSKNLNPFDEMIAAIVISKATIINDDDVSNTGIYFCTLDKKDLIPADQNHRLNQAYRNAGITVLPSFAMPS